MNWLVNGQKTILMTDSLFQSFLSKNSSSTGPSFSNVLLFFVIYVSKPKIFIEAKLKVS